jgi:hypothetical protein
VEKEYDILCPERCVNSKYEAARSPRDRETSDREEDEIVEARLIKREDPILLNLQLFAGRVISALDASGA